MYITFFLASPLSPSISVANISTSISANFVQTAVYLKGESHSALNGFSTRKYGEVNAFKQCGWELMEKYFFLLFLGETIL